ncbi:MAG TPA: heparinase II/III family protein [Hyphomicrobiales bacterium]|nr:heparinase II/III family protein [Hyphomicrobiales bacterium]
MFAAKLRERGRIALLLARAFTRALRRVVYVSPLYRWRFSGPMADRLLLAPQDLRTSDPTVANEIYDGRFSLAGQVAAIGQGSPFTLVPPPSPEWQRELVEFGWLRHLRATNAALARSQARALIDDGILSAGQWREPSADPEVTARRIISWLCHSPLILEGADRPFYRRFLRSLNRQIRYLRKAASTAPEGLPRLTAIIALNYAGLCLGGLNRLQRRSARWLNEELTRQVLPDGGHVSRDPGAIVTMLLDLLPLRQTFSARQIQPPPGLLNAIDRMMPMIRFFRHGDGAFALFNGMGASPTDAAATVLAYDDSFGKPIDNASYSGYQRLTAGETTLIMDTGPPPPIALSEKAHAGCLAFELSAGPQRIIVNCGIPVNDSRAWRRAARSTAAHSTATIEDTSSCRFAIDHWLAEILGEVVLVGPRQVQVARDTAEGRVRVAARHDGYRQRFGILHERRLELSADGRSLAGEDNFTTSRKRANPGYALRFHLHPEIRASRAENGKSISLTLPNKETWNFVVQGAEAEIEESVYLPEADGPRRTDQIVVYGRINHQPRVAWSLAQASDAAGKAISTGTKAVEAPELPLEQE